MRHFGVVMVVGILAGPRAWAYDQPVHVLLSKRAYGGPKELAAEDQASKRAAAALRERLYKAGAEARDPALKKRFLARWPEPARFDAWAVKELLALNPEKSVAGIDDVPLPSGSAIDVYAIASRIVDDDHRNRERFRHDEKRQIVKDKNGNPLPADPATLDMGGLTGLSSQAHAHYQLADVQLSEDSNVLKSEPRRFARPATVITFGADFAESYTALAILSARLPSGERLALTHAGAAAHHVEDVANQIHTVQVGVYGFFVDATFEQVKEELRSIGGVLRSRPSLKTIGIGIIKNHHTLLESLFRKHLLTPDDPVAALADRASPDESLTAALQKIPTGCTPGFGRAITKALTERSSLEGGEVYDAIRAVADRRYSRWRVTFEEGDDPDAAIRPGANLGHFWDLQVRGARRSDQSLAAWWQRFEACRRAPDDAITQIAERFLVERLDALDAAEKRAREYVPRPGDGETLNYWVPAGYLVALAVVFLVVRRVRRKKK